MAVCWHCGEIYPDGKLVCPECGADADGTWAPDPGPEDFGAPVYDDSRFSDPEYEDFLKREGLASPSKTGAGARGGKKPFGCGILVLLAVTGFAGILLL